MQGGFLFKGDNWQNCGGKKQLCYYFLLVLKKTREFAPFFRLKLALRQIFGQVNETLVFCTEINLVVSISQTSMFIVDDAITDIPLTPDVFMGSRIPSKLPDEDTTNNK